MRSGLNPVECLKKLEGRIIEFHFKDLNKAGPKAYDVPWGTGVCDVKGMLDRDPPPEGPRRSSPIEYEHNWENSLPEIAQCVAYFDKVAAELAAWDMNLPWSALRTQLAVGCHGTLASPCVAVQCAYRAHASVGVARDMTPSGCGGVFSCPGVAQTANYRHGPSGHFRKCEFGRCPILGQRLACAELRTPARMRHSASNDVTACSAITSAPP